jgi:hypothetical protein
MIMPEPYRDNPVASKAMLHLLAGPWGSGKTSLVPHLRQLLPEVVVFDWDVLLPGLSQAAATDPYTDSSTWHGLEAMWTAIVGAVLSGGRDVLLCRPAEPEVFVQHGIPSHSIRCAYLDCADEILAERLRNRGETDEDIAEELAAMANLRRSCHKPLPVAGRTPEQLAEDVTAWVGYGRRTPIQLIRQYRREDHERI